MEEKNLTPQESMAVIARMIEATKQRVSMPELRISIMWAALTIVSAAVVLIVSLINYTPWINIVWFAIPAIGYPANFAMVKRCGIEKGAKTAIDMIRDGIWKVVTIISIALSLVCILFNIIGYPKAWLLMFYFAFVVVGFGVAAQGVVLKEKSYVFGGIFSIIAGFVVIALTICNIPLLIVWVLPLYIFCFLLMFIVPAFIIRKKLNAAQR